MVNYCNIIFIIYIYWFISTIKFFFDSTFLICIPNGNFESSKLKI